MRNKELKQQIAENEALHIANVMHCLKQDPNASDDDKSYKETSQYLKELIEKDGSLLNGLIIALEHYLEK
jgi:hypothetical protein